MEIRGRVSTKYRVWPTETLFIFSSESIISHFRLVNRYISYENKQKGLSILYHSGQYFIDTRNFLDQQIRRRFSSWSLAFFANATGMLRMLNVPTSELWPVTVSNPRPPVPPAYTFTSSALHTFCCESPETRQEGPH